VDMFFPYVGWSSGIIYCIGSVYTCFLERELTYFTTGLPDKFVYLRQIIT
jgi:hypothetical protein